MIRLRVLPRLVLLFAAAILSVAVGCSSKPKASPAGAQSLSGTDEQIFMGDTIEKNYDPNVIMKRAEAFFDKEEYPEAIIEYQHFLDLHRVHVLASYAQFKLGESHFKLQKTADRDPEPVYRAVEAFEKLRKDFPGSQYHAEAVERIRACHNMIAEAYYLIGQFYYRREAYLAAARRFEAITNLYPEMDVAGEALYYLALTYSDLGADEWAREKLTVLAERYPNNKFRAESKQLLARLETRQPATAVAMSEVSSNGTSANGAHGLNGTRPHSPGTPTVSPVTALRNANGVSPAPRTILCRLGIWC
ncbi:MAG: outer membrane protein assembly factor BamD [Nitrospiraceae bacterium]